MAEKKQRKPTSTDVAELAGVSQTSVSLVLSGSSRATFSEQTRARVFEAARQLGYQPPAHRTRKKNGNDRRLILVLTPTLANQYYSELIQTLEDYAGSQEFRVLVCNTFRKRELEKYYLEQFSDNRISGIVYTFLPSFPDEAVRLSARIPLVLIGEKREELPICSIELSNQRAGAMLADHLYSLGHRHAAFISTPMDQTTLARKQRLEGLRQRFHERGRQDGVETSVEALVAPDSREEDGVGGSVPFEYATGARLARELLAREAGLKLPDSEVVNIALHLINAEAEAGDMHSMMMTLKALSDVDGIVEKQLAITLNKESFSYSRFSMHLRYLIQRLASGRQVEERISGMLAQMRRDYPQAYQCARAIADYFRAAWNWQCNDEEIVYLMLHITRLQEKNEA